MENDTTKTRRDHQEPSVTIVRASSWTYYDDHSFSLQARRAAQFPTAQLSVQSRRFRFTYAPFLSYLLLFLFHVCLVSVVRDEQQADAHRSSALTVLAGT
jgi:hypothetical protein